MTRDIIIRQDLIEGKISFSRQKDNSEGKKSKWVKTSVHIKKAGRCGLVGIGLCSLRSYGLYDEA